MNITPTRRRGLLRSARLMGTAVDPGIKSGQTDRAVDGLVAAPDFHALHAMSGRFKVGHDETQAAWPQRWNFTTTTRHDSTDRENSQ